MRTMRWLGVCLAVVTWLVACGGGEDVTKARVRLVNASSGYASLDLIVDDARLFSAVTYGGSNDYLDVDPSNADSELRRAGAATALLTFTPALTKNRNYTVLAYGGEGALKTLLLDDNTDTPPNGKTRLRIVNAAPARWTSTSPAPTNC